MNTTTCANRRTNRPSTATTSPRLRYKHLAFGVGLALGSLLVCGVAAAAPGIAANASPTGGAVVGGVGSITHQGASTIVSQQSKLLSLNWQTFNVGKNASVLFKQPGLSAIALNRILDQNPSQIFGKISSNGQIFLINTHGIIFGASAQLNVGGLVASTLDLTPPDFLAQHFNLDAHGGSAGIVNHGTIAAASGGSVSLIGGQVENDGLIVADYGHINLDGADQAVLNFDGDGLINVQITGALKQRLDADQAAVVNKGTLRADSGSVVLQASAAKNLFTNLVNNSGVIDAHGISTAGGVVRLVGSGGNVIDSGSINVSGTHGGSAQLLSDQNVGVTGGGINASGTYGGGSIRVGGGLHGGEGLQTASAAYVAPDATLNASATQLGNGGSVVVWGNNVNNFFGSIFARGGAFSGNGGQVETSSHYGLNAQGAVDTSAPHGQAGSWLMDPYDVEIVSGGSGSLTGGIFSSSSTVSTIAPGTIETALEGGTNVSIFTGGGGSNNPTGGDITVTDPIAVTNATGASTLSLQAAGSIFLNAGISGDGTHALNVNLWANYGGAAGDTTYTHAGTCVATSGCVVDIGGASAAGSITTDGGYLDVETGPDYGGGALNIGKLGKSGDINTGNGYLIVSAASINQGLGTIKVGGTSNFSTGDTTPGDISLANGGNKFDGLITINHAGAVELNGTGTLDIAGVADTASLTLDGASELDGDITTSGAQTYNGAVALGANVTLTTTSNGAVTFGSTVDNADTTARTLKVDAGTGAVKFGDAVGGGTNGGLSSLDVAGTGTTTLDGNITTSGAQTYNGAVALGADVTASSTGNGAIDFAKTVDGAHALTVDTGGVTTFGGAVGGTTKLASLTTDAAGSTTLDANVTTTGAQTYNDAVTLGADVTASSTGNGAIDFAKTVDGAHALTVDTGGVTTFGGIVGGSNALTSLTTDAAGSTTLDANVTTTGAQTYNDAVALGGNIILTTTSNGDVTFASTVGNAGATAENLTVNAGSGAVSFGGAVGSASDPLGVLEIDGTGNTKFASTVNAASLATNNTGTTTLDGNITTSGAQTYNGAVALGADVTASSTGNGAIDFAKTVDGGYALTVDTGGVTTFGGAVGGTTKLASLTTDAAGSTTLDANVTTTGAQTYNDAVTLGADVTASSTGNGAIDFAKTVDGGYALTVDTGGVTTFGGAVGGTTKLASLTTDAAGSTQLDTNVATSGAQTYNDAVALGGNVAVSTANGPVTFASTVGNAGATAENLTVNAGSGAVNFGGAVGSASDPLGALEIDGTGNTKFASTVNAASLATNNTGTTTLDGNITTSGAQTYNGTTALGGNITLSGSQVTLNGVTGNSHDLIVTGNAELDGALNNLSSLSISGTTALGIANITTTGSQTYTGAVTLDNNAVLKSTNGSVDFGSTVDSKPATNNSLEVDAASGTVSFGGAVGGFQQLNDLTVDSNTLSAPSNLSVTGNLSITTIAALTSGGAWSGANVTLVSDGNLTLSGDVTATASNGTVTLASGGNISQSTGAISANTLTGSSSGSTVLTGGNNTIANVAGFTSHGGFNLADAQTLDVTGAVNDSTGGVTLTTTGTGHGLTVGSNLQGTAVTLDSAGDLALNATVSSGANGTTTLKSGGAITEDTTNGALIAGFLTGQSSGATTLKSNLNQVGELDGFTAAGLTLFDAHDLFVKGPVNSTGDINFTTLPGYALTVGQVLTGGAITLDSGKDLTVSNNITGTAVTLGANGNLLINALVDSGTGTTTLTQTGTGSISEGSGSITAGTLKGSSTGATNLASGSNAIGTLAGFSTGGGFNLVNNQALDVTNAVTGGTGDVDLTTQAGNLDIAADLTGSNVALDSAGALTLAGNLTATAANGIVKLDSSSTISQSAGKITASVLTGSSGGTTSLGMGNIIASLGSFNASGAFSLVNDQALNVTGPVSAVGDVGLTTSTGALSINGTVTGADVALDGASTLALAANVTATAAAGYVNLASGGAISQTGGAINANSLTGNASGLATLSANNLVANLGNFSANGFSLTNAQNLNVAGTLNSGTGTTTLNVTGALTEGASGAVVATNLTGSSTGDTTLASNNNQIGELDAFSAKDLTLVNDANLAVAGPITTVGNVGNISLTTLPGYTLTVGQLSTGGAIALTSGSSLAVNNDITGSSVGLTAAGNLAINATVDSGAGTTTLKSGGAITEDTTNGAIVAGFLTGNSTGSTDLASTHNQVAELDAFTAAGITLVDNHDLFVKGPVNSTGDINFTTLPGYALNVGQALSGGAVTLSSGKDLSISNDVTGTAVNLTAHGNLAIDAAVNSGSGTTTLTQLGTGAISENNQGAITAGTLQGHSDGQTDLAQGTNSITNLGAFSANGFALTDNHALTVLAGSSVGGNGSTLIKTTGTGSNLAIDGSIRGNGVTLTSAGAINEGAGGVVQAATLTGSSVGATNLTGNNAVVSLGNFTATGFALTNGQALTVANNATVDGGSSTVLETTGPSSDLQINGTVSGTNTRLVASGGIGEGSQGVIIANSLTGSAAAAATLDGANQIATLGNFSANGFALNDGTALTIANGAVVNGGSATSITTTNSGSDLTINGTLKGTATQLVSAGAISEGVSGKIQAGTLTGSAVHGAQLTGTNAISTLGNFSAQGLALTNGQALTIANGATVDGGASTTLTTTGANGNLTIDGTLKGTTTTLLASGGIHEGGNGALQAATLSGSSVGATSLTGHNDVSGLGNFTANGFSLTTGSDLTVIAGNTLNGGTTTTLTTTGSGHDLAIDGNVQGGTTKLVATGAISEGSGGRIVASTLTGSSVGDTTLKTANQIAALGQFNAKNFYLTDAHALAVGGPLTTTGSAGNISLTTTGGTGNTLTVNQAVHGAEISMTSAGDLTVANAITGTQVELASNGQLAIDALVDSGNGTVTLSQAGSGGILGGANGGITAGTLTGSAVGATVLGSAGQFMGNHVGILGGFNSPAGFSFTNDGTLTLASVNGSAYTVNAGQSPLYLAVENGDLLQDGSNWLYDSVGTWASTGHIGLSTAPIYVMGVSNQTVASIGLPPAYFYAIDQNGNLLPLSGGNSVNVPTSILSSNSQGVNGHTDHYIDISVITANYRSYGVVPPGLLLPPDQLECPPDQTSSSSQCPENN